MLSPESVDGGLALRHRPAGSEDSVLRGELGSSHSPLTSTRPGQPGDDFLRRMDRMSLSPAKMT